jgi:hypothetical protein
MKYVFIFSTTLFWNISHSSKVKQVVLPLPNTMHATQYVEFYVRVLIFLPCCQNI